MAKDRILLKFEDDKKLTRLFKNLDIKEQHKVVINSFKETGKQINKEAKKNLKQRTNVSRPKGFKMKKMRNRVGIVVGVNNFIYKFLETGTKERHYISKTGKKHFTGRIKPSYFFKDARESNQDEAQDNLMMNIKKSLENALSKS